MKLSGTYSIPAPAERVYWLLQDPEVLAQCMPGCDKLVKTGPDEYAIQMKLLIASVSGLFEGKVRLSDQQPPHRFAMQVDGKGKIGFMNGQGTIELTNAETGTALSYEGDVQLGGTIAAVGQRLVDTTSRMMLKRFFDKLSEISRAEPADKSAQAS